MQTLTISITICFQQLKDVTFSVSVLSHEMGILSYCCHLVLETLRPLVKSASKSHSFYCHHTKTNCN